MNFFIIVPEKPLYGEPCNGCGVCCRQQMCDVGQYLHPDLDKYSECPELTWDGKQYRCGQLLDIADPLMLEFRKLIIGSGRGCCCRETSEDIRRSKAVDAKWSLQRPSVNRRIEQLTELLKRRETKAIEL